MSKFVAGSTLPQRDFEFGGIFPLIGAALKFLAPVVLPAIIPKVQQAVGGAVERFVGGPARAAMEEEEFAEDDFGDFSDLSDRELIQLADELAETGEDPELEAEINAEMERRGRGRGKPAPFAFRSQPIKTLDVGQPIKTVSSVPPAIIGGARFGGILER